MALRRPPVPLAPADILRSRLCIGCGACAAGAAGARMDFDAYGQYRPAGPPAWLRRRSAEFARTCPFSPHARNEDELAAELFPTAREHHGATGRFRAAYVGYVAEDEFRARGSSGGLVSWVLAELLRRGLIDGAAHVAPADPRREGRLFRYRISRSEEEIRAGAKSRYYPVELSAVLAHIRSTPGRYALVGVPCFIKAVQLLRREDPVLRERVAFTLGLFCGHMKSARFVESFAWQMGSPIEEVERVEFRLKDPARPASTYTAALTLRDGRLLARDWWNLADGDWGAGFFQHAACNFCDDVTAETADISFGDAWVEPYASDGRGTNVVVIRSPELEALVAAGIRDGRLKLAPVDGEFVAATQAAGLRQRREGLAYRLTWRRSGLWPRKRVVPGAGALLPRRKLIYRSRALISAWSHRVFRLARWLRQPEVYIRWARGMLAIYHGLAYSRGRLGKALERLGLD
jgi:coenzyme F420-reducing hydrogenase beta subunit